MRRERCRVEGISLIEMVVALTLGALVVNLGLLTVQRTRRAQLRIVERIDALGSFRVGRFVPRRELRHARVGLDWFVDEDSLALRAFRGTGIVCPPDGRSAEMIVSFRGARQPNPEKDSVLLITVDGGRVVAGLSAVASVANACGRGPSPPQRWRLDRPVPSDVVLARVFERGSYHLSGSALRYRRAGGGRQPLTPEVWSMPATRWTESAERVGFDYVPSRRTSERGWAGFLAWRDER